MCIYEKSRDIFSYLYGYYAVLVVNLLIAHLIKCIHKNMTKKYLNVKTQCNILIVHNVYCKMIGFRSKCMQMCTYLRDSWH